MNRKKLIDDYKCCGNCKHNQSIPDGLWGREEDCNIGINSIDSCAYCDNWEYDGLTRKDRQIDE